MPCNASYTRFIFLKVFHMYYNLICTPMWTNFFILVKSGCYKGTPNVDFSGFNFILHFLRLSKASCQVRDESLFFPSLYDHVINICFCLTSNL
jgi:hypothetical protein